jgi:hypothetical protein
MDEIHNDLTARNSIQPKAIPSLTLVQQFNHYVKKEKKYINTK